MRSQKTTATTALIPIESAPLTRLLRIREVCALVGYAPASLYRLMEEGRFPRQVKLPGGRSVRWREDHVRAWIEGCLLVGAAEPKSTEAA